MIEGLKYRPVTYCEKCKSNGLSGSKYCGWCGTPNPSTYQVLEKDDFLRLYNDIMSVLGDCEPHSASTSAVLNAINCDSTGLLRQARDIANDWYTVGEMSMEERIKKVLDLEKQAGLLYQLIRNALPNMAAHNELINDSCDWATEAVAGAVMDVGRTFSRMLGEEFGVVGYDWGWVVGNPRSRRIALEKLASRLASGLVVLFSQEEEHEYNDNAVALTIYLERKPTEEEMKRIIEMEMGGYYDDDDSDNPGPEYTWWESPNLVSEKAGLIRIQIG